MQTFNNVTDARNAIMDFRADHGSEIPNYLRPRFRELSASPAPLDQLVGVGEFIYANRAELTNPAKDLAAGLMAFCTTNGFYGLLDNDRGNLIVANLRKDLGEIKSAGAAPDPLPAYVVEKPTEPEA